MQTEIAESRSLSLFRSYDPRLEPIAAKVFAGERLSFSDGVTLYGSTDVLALAGWPTMCVTDAWRRDLFQRQSPHNRQCMRGGLQAVRLWPQEGDRPATPWRLKKHGDRGVRLLGSSDGVSHCGGLHPDLPSSTSLTSFRAETALPNVHIKAFTMVEVPTWRGGRS